MNKIANRLKGKGFVVNIFQGYDNFIQNYEDISHLYIIDQCLWEKSGIELISWLREIKKSAAPILITSGFIRAENIASTLNSWADDYISKPFDFDELLARIRALLRRTTRVDIQKNIEYNDISLLLEERVVRVKEENIHLTQKEFLFLELFLLRPWKIIDRAHIISYIWGGNRLMTISDNTINATLSKLRKKLLWNFTPKPIYNQGYILE